MLCISEDDYSDSEHVHIGKYAAPRPHIQADLYRLGREIQRILMDEPGYSLNLCKLREKYEFFYGKPLDKLGYSKLVDCVYALPEPITTRNVRPNGVALLLMRPMRDSCKAFQRGQCPKQPDECDCEHECDLCGYPMHGASQCVDEGAPDTKPVQSYTHCCLRSKCVGDIHNPDVFVPDADDLILADLSVNTNRISVEEMLQMEKKYQAPPAFTNPGLECVNGRPIMRPAPRRPRVAPPLDEKQMKIRTFYAHFVAWFKNRYCEFQDWPRDREDFSFEWESYLSGNREMRQTVVALIDFSPSAALVYLSTEVHIVAIVNLTELVWNPNAVAELLQITGAAPPPSRRWSQSSSQWGEGDSFTAVARNSTPPAPRPWANQVVPATTAPEISAAQQPQAAEQKVVFMISKSNDIQDPQASSRVWHPELPERYISKIPIPTFSRYLDEGEDEDENLQSRAWSSNWRPKTSDYTNDNEWDSNANSNYASTYGSYAHARANGLNANANSKYTNSEEVCAVINDDEEEEEGAINEDEEFVTENEVDDAIVDSSFEIQHEYYEEVVQSTHQPLPHDSVSHMDNIANAYASDSSSDGELPDEDHLPPSAMEPKSVQSSPVKTPVQEPPSWTEQRDQSSVVNSSFSALFGNSAPSQQLLPDQPFVAEFGSEEYESRRNVENIPPPSAVAFNWTSTSEAKISADTKICISEAKISCEMQPKMPVDSKSQVLCAATPEFVLPPSKSASSESKPMLSPSAPEFSPPSVLDPSTPALSPFASEFVASQPVDSLDAENTIDEAEPDDEEDRPPKITIDNKIVVGDGIGQNYRRMNDIVSRASNFAFSSDVSSSEVVADLKRLGLAEGVAPNMTWNTDRVQEIESLLSPRASNFEPASQQIVSDQNEEFLKNLLYQAILGTKPTSNEEIDLFIHECLRLQHAGVDSVLAGMRSLWVASRNCSSTGVSLFQASANRPVIANEAHSSKPEGLRCSKGTSRLAPSNMRKFLQEADLEKWQRIFSDQEIGFELLPELTDADLIDIGMTNICERQRFHDTVRMMKY